MQIIHYNKSYLPEIISLLKESLGESLIPKSEAYFEWKHEKNPFGHSTILLAKENGKIIGIRVFMKWQWESSTLKINAVRAVDTATKPEYQGKGIFKKLNLQAIEESFLEKVQFVFNTPNRHTYNGNLKMGWFSTGKMPLMIGVGSLIPQFYTERMADIVYEQYNTKNVFEELCQSWEVNSDTKLFHTPINKQFLKWRYNDCPVANYGTIIQTGKFGIVFRIKKINCFIELRICEIWTENDEMANEAIKSFRNLIKKIRPIMVSCAPSPLFVGGKKKLPGLFGPIKKGPITTLRPITMDKLEPFEQFYQWRPSIGSMELF